LLHSDHQDNNNLALQLKISQKQFNDLFETDLCTKKHLAAADSNHRGPHSLSFLLPLHEEIQVTFLAHELKFVFRQSNEQAPQLASLLLHCHFLWEGNGTSAQILEQNLA